MHELEDKLEVETPLGRGKAILVSESDYDTFWTVVLDDSCAIVTFRQHELKVVRNYGMGWGMSVRELEAVIKASK